MLKDKIENNKIEEEKEPSFDLEELVLKINQLEDQEKKAEKIKHLIKDIIQQYRNKKMNVDDLEILLKDLADIKDYFTIYYYDNEFEEEFPATELSDYAYNQEGIDFLVNSFENNIRNYEGERKEIVMDDFNFIMTIATRNWQEKDSIGDLFVKNAINLSEKKSEKSDELKECQWKIFGRSRFKIKEENYLDFLVAMINDKQRSQKYVSYIIEMIILGVFNKQGFRNKIKDFSERVENYFASKLINRKLEDPLENISIDQKKKFLEEYWEKLNRANNFYDTLAFAPSLVKRGFTHPDSQLTINDLNDRDIEIVFRKASFKERGILKRLENQRIIERYAVDTRKELLRDGEEFFGEETTYRFQPFLDYKAVLNREGGIKYFEKEDDGEKEKFYTVEEVLEQEGYKQKMSDDEFSNLVYNFEFLTDLRGREEIEKDLKIDLSRFNIRELFQFVNFLSTKNQEDISRIRDFFSKMNTLESSDYLRTFLSLEIGQNMGDEILLIGEKMGIGDANKIFAQYTRIVDTTKNISQELKGRFENKLISEEDVKNISRNVLEKATCLLNDFAKKIEKGEDLNEVKILKILEDYEDDLLFTFSVFKQLRDDVGLDDLEGVILKKIKLERYRDIYNEIDQMVKGDYLIKKNDSEELKEVFEMFELYKKNYAERGDFLKELLKGFADVLKGKDRDTNIYMIKKNDKVVAFNRFDNLGDGKKYFGSCNVLPSLQASSIGGEMFKQSLNQESSESEINATVDAFSPVSCLYIEKGKFQVQGIDLESDPDGIPWFILRRDSDEKRKSFYENKFKDELILEYLKQDEDNLEKKSHFIFKFDGSTKHKNEIISFVNKEGFKITRSFFDKSNNLTYFAFEKL